MARRLDVPADALADQMRFMNRAAFARMAARIREKWAVDAYMFYCHLLQNGLTRESDGVLTLAFKIPDEILKIPPGRRRQLDPHEVATWAYKRRQQGTTWAELQRESEKFDPDAWERSKGRVKEIEGVIAALRKEPLTEEVEEEIAYQSALLEFVKAPLERFDKLPGHTASSIRNAVLRNLDIWEIAERHPDN